MSKRKSKQDAMLEEKLVAEASAAIVTKQRGGKRPGAGRKPNYLKRAMMPAVTAHEILSSFDLIKLWGSLLNSKNDDIRFRAVSYLTDREQGRPKNISEFTGEVSQYTHLSAADLEAQIEEIKGRLGLQKIPPASEPSPNHATAPTVSTTQAVKPFGVLETEPYKEPLPPELECARHGKYFRPVNAKSEMCPQCIADAERDDKRLRSLLPGAMA